MRPVRLTLVLAGCLSCGVLSVASSALGVPSVTVRIVGESSTLLPLTNVTLNKPDPFASSCAVNSANAAINSAVESVNGSWDHGNAAGAGGDFTETILGETHVFNPTEWTWDVWINDKWASGICEDLLGEGDELLVAADYEPQPTYAPTRLPLVLRESPPIVTAGTPFTVRVEKVHTRPGTYPEIGEGTLVPEEGATVSGGGVSAQTKSNGEATLTLCSAGVYSLAATEPGAVPSAPVSISVRAANEPVCGSGAAPSSAGNPASSSSSIPVASPYKGPYALVASMTSVRNGHTYARATAPRLLAGKILSHSAVSSVQLELRREFLGRCSTYEALRGRFVRARCGSGRLFTASSSSSFSYLLPKRLGPGRYVLDVAALDVAGNRTTLARGSSRTVFYVR
jgi:hypothetical protein